MQHIALRPHGAQSVLDELSRLVEEGKLTKLQAEAVDVSEIAAFFASPLGLRLCGAAHVRREVAFNISLSARALELSGMPPTCSFVGTIEPFYDETVAYINALEESGVPTFFETFEGCFHAFDIMCPKSGAAKRATALLMDSFHYALHNFTAAQYGAVQTGGNT